MKGTMLSKEEKRFERDFDILQPVSPETKDRIEKIIASSQKSRPISLRINENDLVQLKEKASKNGLPYQTMINVIIHKYVTDSYLDKEEINKFLQLKRAY